MNAKSKLVIILVIAVFIFTQCNKDANLLKLIEKGDLDKIQTEVNSGANVNAAAKDGDSALVLSIKSGKSDIAEFLINSGADINVLSKDKESVLILAVNSNMAGVAKLLISKGADLNAKNSAGATVIDLLSKKDLLDKLYVSVKSGVSLKESPEEKAKDIEKLSYNQKLLVLETGTKLEKIGGAESNWNKVIFNGKTGWVFGANTAFFDQEKPGENTISSPNFIFVPGGTFNMGNTFDDDGQSDERPAHIVTVGSFWISKYEVTQKEWNAVMNSNDSKFKGEKLPVDSISWQEAIQFCNDKSKKDGLKEYYKITKDKVKDSDEEKWTVTADKNANGYRLPTEEEWEYAARYQDGKKWTPSNFMSGSTAMYGDEAASGLVAWYGANSNSTTHDVGTKKPNQLGIYDMSGNVWEWCFTTYYRYPGNTDKNDKFVKDLKVLRGGMRDSDEIECRVVNRTAHPQYLKNEFFGLRLARTH